ncbi:hypothetical protein [Timonella sp. A28]|uniref:hypothetical protein n=1 Tax=Timonella sp. A28 TaxID=3442640 RepID=UPI003EB6B243
MPSSSTRFTAGLLALAIPFVPAIAHAQTMTGDAPTVSSHRASALPSAIGASASSFTAAERATLESAIDAAMHASAYAQYAIQFAYHADPFETSLIEDYYVYALTSVEAARAELAHALATVPTNEPQLTLLLHKMQHRLDLLHKHLNA